MQGWLGWQAGSGGSRNGCGLQRRWHCGWVEYCGRVRLSFIFVVGSGVHELLGKAAVILGGRSAIAMARQSTALARQLTT